DDGAGRVEAYHAAHVLAESHAENRDCRQSHALLLLLKLRRAYDAGRRGGPFHKLPPNAGRAISAYSGGIPRNHGRSSRLAVLATICRNGGRTLDAVNFRNGRVLPSGDHRERQDSIVNRPFCMSRST